MMQDVENITRQSNNSVSCPASVLGMAKETSRSLLTLIFFWGAISASTASQAQTALQGVWQGQLGSSAITACFNPQANGDGGSYYYNRHRVPIPLSATSVPGAWNEHTEDGQSTGTWNIDTSSDAAIKGTWHSPKDATALPIVLQRVEPSEASTDCGSDAYVNSLEATNGMTTIEKGSTNGHAYTVATKAGQKTLSVVGNNDSATRKINKAIAKIAYDPKGVETFNRERRESLTDFAKPFTSEISVKPTYWTTHWVTVQFYHWEKGYGRSGISWTYHTWNLDTGDEVDPWSWIGSQEKLNAWLKAHTELGPECADSEHGPLELTFDAKGINLAEAATGRDCDLDYSLSWLDVKPMLSAKGKAAYDSLQDK
ncbi:hypothetical protein HX870_05620 [Pseudomonas gingeri]|uniref:hypothetical protein n=1 Tax=Pseudomonas gingeri TaxID=117681 RepID=UPI0015A04831|nr:hypothetical protein [Pseudomonas gingeri]NWD67073.1 hypothetical protein [Pseudomonas gingeri]